MAKIKKLIRSRILGIFGDAKAPTFVDWEINEALMIVCASKKSEEWLRNHSSDWKIRGTPLRVCRPVSYRGVIG